MAARFLNQLHRPTPRLATFATALLLIWLPTRIDPFDTPLAARPKPPLKMIVLPAPAAEPPSEMPRAADIVTPLPVFSEKELPVITVPV